MRGENITTLIRFIFFNNSNNISSLSSLFPPLPSLPPRLETGDGETEADEGAGDGVQGKIDIDIYEQFVVPFKIIQNSLFKIDTVSLSSTEFTQIR